MNFTELPLQRSYKSCGDNTISDSFLVPALKCTKIYKRSVGFFSSGVLTTIMDGIIALARNKGTIRLIASPMLSEEDINAINSGYEIRDKIINEAFSRDFISEIDKMDDTTLQMLQELVARGILDIKIAVANSLGNYHDKLGILEDFSGNKIVFYGSANSSINGYRDNYEKIRIVRGWAEGEKESVKDEELEFDTLWMGKNKYVEVLDYRKSAQENILKVIKSHRSSGKSNKVPVKLRDYQEQAISSWVNNDYHGFYVMATGTGKTWTAIYSAKALIEKHPCMIVICAPYKHLVKQWAEDVQKAFPNGKIILVSSERAT